MIPRLLVITPGHEVASTTWVQWLLDLPAHPAASVLIREPTLPAPAVLASIAALRSTWSLIVHTKTPGCRIALQQWPELGVHRSSTSEWPDVTLSQRMCGVSCHDANDVHMAFEHGASYAVLSPVFRPHSKADDLRAPLGWSGFYAVAQGLPVLALGGMDTARVQTLWQAGGFGAALLGEVLGAGSFETARRHWQELRELLGVRGVTGNAAEIPR